MADGRYVFERVLGEGGMGVVYAGRHKVIGKRVAIKVLRRNLANDREVNGRFLQEARAASAIGNPHIVDISDFGNLADGSMYFVMELLEGTSLADVLAHAKGPMPAARLCPIARQIAEGLGAAHDANIVHRDLKPDNVMLVSRGAERDFVKILDFGIAKVGSESVRVTRAGSIFGTPHYMSPEQAAGTTVDRRTDVYALGVILYEMASGKVPFDADSFMGIITQHMYKAPVPIRELVPEADVPPGLDAIILKCLTKKPEGRYATMADLVADLDKLASGSVPDAVGEMMSRLGGFDVPPDYLRLSGSTPVPAASPRQRRRVRVTASAAGTIAGLLAVFLAVRGPGGKSGTATAGHSTIGALAPRPETATRISPPIAVPSGPATREVLVSVTPGDATIERDGTSLGSSPVALHLADGEEARLVLSYKGYKDRTVTVTASEPKQAFTLERAAPSRAKAAPKAASPGDTRVEDVGDPFAVRR
ncbi:MAG: protein kinase [Polyangiaceae bacterium]|nr:protein kinase [Polyangiaceae bacterium]